MASVTMNGYQYINSTYTGTWKTDKYNNPTLSVCKDGTTSYRPIWKLTVAPSTNRVVYSLTVTLKIKPYTSSDGTSGKANVTLCLLDKDPGNVSVGTKISALTGTKIKKTAEKTITSSNETSYTFTFSGLSLNKSTTLYLWVALTGTWSGTAYCRQAASSSTSAAWSITGTVVEKRGVVYVYSGSWKVATPYIYNGSSWVLATPDIYSSGW